MKKESAFEKSACKHAPFLDKVFGAFSFWMFGGISLFSSFLAIAQFNLANFYRLDTPRSEIIVSPPKQSMLSIKQEQSNRTLVGYYLPNSFVSESAATIGSPASWFFSRNAAMTNFLAHSERCTIFSPAVALPLAMSQSMTASDTQRVTVKDCYGESRAIDLVVLSFVSREKLSDGFFVETLRVTLPTTVLIFGYQIGFVGTEPLIQLLRRPSDIAPSWFSLATLPAPIPEGTTIEYRNTANFPLSPGGQYFYTADPAEQAFVDAGGAGKFVRTGKSFAAGGYVRLCRFYGSQKPGPNSHFFTTDDNECKQLQALQKTPTPSISPQWNFEGYAFGMNAIRRNADGTRECPTGSIPVYRAYNRAFDDAGKKNAWDSNHRFSTNKADIAEVVAQGWKEEGAVMCAPS